MVLERRDSLEPLLGSPGTVVEAQVSPELLESLLTPATPLHDGALYLRREWIYRAGFDQGRHIIGYEVQKVLALVDWFRTLDRDRPIDESGVTRS